MSKTVTMSIGQFMDMERGTLALSDITKERDLEYIAGKILNNEKLKRFFVTFVATATMCAEAMAETNVADATAKLGSATGKIITITQFAIGKICIIACILEIGKCLISKRREEIPQIGMKYFIAYLVVKLIPWLFDLIDSTF